MEEKVYDAFDSLDINETDSLLEKELRFEVDSATLRRIKHSTYAKAGIRRKPRFITRGLPAVAAAMLIILLSVFSIGFDNVVNAMGKFFGFIPGYGIVVEDSQSIQYVIDGHNVTAKNSQAVITISNAIATKSSLAINYEVEAADFDETMALEQKEKDMAELNNDIPTKDNFTLTVNGKEYKPSGYSIGGGGKTELISTDYEIEQENLNTKTVYKLNYGKYNLTVDFKLKKPEGYNSLDEIGPTDTKNNISITAISSHKDDKLMVELYPFNNSGYTITSFNKKYDYGYEKKDLYLETNLSKNSYTIPDSFMGPNNRFYFNVVPEEKNLVLKIPYIIVKSEDEKNRVTLNIPQEGEKTSVNKKVKFKDSTMIITDVERIKNPSANGALRIYVKYENSNKNMVMCDAQFKRLNALGKVKGGGYSTKVQDGIVEFIDYDLEKSDGKVLRLGIEDPEYFLLGEYNIRLD